MPLVNESQLLMALERLVDEKYPLHPELIEKYLSRGVRIYGDWYWDMSDVKSYYLAVLKAGKHGGR